MLKIIKVVYGLCGSLTFLSRFIHWEPEASASRPHDYLRDASLPSFYLQIALGDKWDVSTREKKMRGSETFPSEL